LPERVTVLLVVFGAGASFDSVPEFPASGGKYMDVRPPLANNLFDTRAIFRLPMLRYPACKAVIPDLRDLGNVTVEQVLTTLQNHANDDPMARQQLAAIRYYLHDALLKCEQEWEQVHGGITNHKTLLNRIQRWRRESNEPVVIVTFNYDRMIENAMTEYFSPRFPFAFKTGFDDYIGEPDYKLIKLHGSVNWAHRVIHPPISMAETTGGGAYDKVIRAGELQVSETFHITTGEGTMFDDQGGVLYPAIAIPVVDKKDFECPKEQVEALTQALPQVTRILTIGWRGTEQNFVELLHKHTHPLPYIMTIAANRQEADKIGGSLISSGKAHRGIIPAKGGFTEAIRSGEIEEFLRQ
jgi:hypothetical protein